MGLLDGGIDFLSKMGNRPDANPNLDTQRISTPNRSNYEAANPYQAEASIAQAESDRKRITDQIAQLEAKLSTVVVSPPDLGGMSSEKIESSGLRDPHTLALKKKIADWRAAETMRKGLVDQITALKAQYNDIDRRVNSAKGAQASETAAKGYESRQIDPNAYNLMRDAAEGKSPSQAQLMLQNESTNLANVARRQGNQMFNQNMSMVNSARSYNPALARAALFQNASQQADLGGRTLEGQQNLAGQGAAMRAQEMAAARSAYGQYGLSQQGQNDQMAQGIRGLNANYAGLNLQGGMGYSGDTMKSEALNQQNDMWRRETEMGAKNARLQANKDAWSSAAATIKGEEETAKDVAGGLLSFSDARTKKNIQPVASLTDQFAAMTPVSYDYKPQFGGGSRVGVVAQDVEQTPVGRLMVGSKSIGGKQVKTIDQPAAVSTLLATAAEQAKRIKDLEGRLDVGPARVIRNEPQLEIGPARITSAKLRPTGEVHPMTKRPIYINGDGEAMTEYGVSVSDPRLNKGKPTNIPSVWGDRVYYDQDEAVTQAVASQQKFPAYASLNKAAKASAAHSKELGRYLDENGRLLQPQLEIGEAYDVQRGHGPIIPAPKGVTIDTSGRTVLVDDNVPAPQYFGPRARNQGASQLSPAEEQDFFARLGNENRYMSRLPANQLFGENLPSVPQSEANYGREMIKLAAKRKKRGGMI